MRTFSNLGDHPLKFFVGVQMRLESPYALAGEVAVNVAVFDHLLEAILTELGRLRQVHSLPVSDRQCNNQFLAADFRSGSDELKAWSMLYHRYVCTAHDLSIDDIAGEVHEAPRNITRHHARGVTCLTRFLVQQEEQARQQDRQRRLRQTLPPEPVYLVETESVLEMAQHLLLQSEVPRHLVLHGPAGVGKTTLAHTLARHLIDTDERFQDCLWLEADKLPAAPDALAGEVAASLELPLERAPAGQSVRAYLFRYSTLIVLDGADRLLDDEALTERALWLLESAYVVITSRTLPRDRFWFTPFTLPGLTSHEMLRMVDALAASRFSNRSDIVDTVKEGFDTIWTTIGGNPGALDRMMVALRHLPSERALTVSIETLYGEVWESLSTNQRRVWLVALLFPHYRMPYEALCTLTGLAPDMIDQVLGELVHSALLTAKHEEQTVQYTLDQLAAAFLIEQTRQGLLAVTARESASDFLRCALRRRARHIVHEPQAGALALSLLRLAQQMALPTTERWQFMHDLSVQITDANLWQSWLAQLDALQHEEHSPEQQFWLDRALGVALRWTGQLTQAVAPLGRALTAAPTNSIERADVLVELSVVYRYQGRYEDALRHSTAAFDIYRRFETSVSIGRCIHELAQVALEMENFNQALEWLQQLEDWSARTWNIASQVYLGLEQPEQAFQAAQRAIDMLPVLHPHQGRAVSTLAHTYDALGEAEQAVSWLLTAVDLLERDKDIIGHARASNNLAVAYLNHPETEYVLPKREIEQLLVQTLQVQEHIGDEVGRSVTWQNLILLRSAGQGRASPPPMP
ncbi:MAG: tetratricopeptide repeat protein [Anaerolineae bacterium]|nr:tetratricopeptide repeat protein [Anaerolineae bacterium]